MENKVTLLKLGSDPFNYSLNMEKHMEIGSILIAIIGTLLTATGVYLMIKRKYPGEITFFSDSCIGLFDSIVKNMPELVVEYKEEPVGQELILLKGSFLNTGSKDITENMVVEKIAMSLPDNCRWVTAKIASASPKVKANVTVAEKKIIFDIGLFRCKEFIRFEALAELSACDISIEGKDIEERLIKRLKINHRISDTQKIKERELSCQIDAKKKLKRTLIKSLPMCLATISMMVGVTIWYFIGFPGKLRFSIPEGAENTVVVRAVPCADGTLKIKGVTNKSYKTTMTPEQFFKIQGIQPQVTKDKSIYLLPILLFVQFCVVLILPLDEYRNYAKTIKIQNQLGVI